MNEPLTKPPRIEEGDDSINLPDDHVPVSEEELEDAPDLDDEDYDDDV